VCRGLADPSTGMTAGPPSNPAVGSATGQGRSLTYEVTKDDRLVLRLFVMPSDAASVRVAAEVYPATAPATAEPQWRFHQLETREAARFIEETLDAFQYLGCHVQAIDSDDGAPSAHATAA
jgi:hypothetical protein